MTTSISEQCGTTQLYYVILDAVKKAIDMDCVQVDDMGFEVVTLDTNKLYPLRDDRSLLTLFRRGMRSLCSSDAGYQVKRLDSLRHEIVSPREMFDLREY